MPYWLSIILNKKDMNELDELIEYKKGFNS